MSRLSPQRILIAAGSAIGIWVACICLSEIILSRYPVTLGPRQVRTDATQPYIHYIPDTPYVYSRGPLFDQATSGRVNNAGFINPQQYESSVPVPLIAVIGDSYVEAEMVPYSVSLNGRLARAAGSAGRVYSFGIARAPASQYLAYAGMAAERYHSDYVVVCINSGDFFESLLARWPAKGLYQFQERPQGGFAMHLTPYQPQPVREMLRSSALARYLVMNMELPVVFMRSLSQLPQALAFRVADIKALLHLRSSPDAAPHGDDLTGPDVRKAADVFLQWLPSYAHLPPSRIVLVFDASRPHIYSGGPPDVWTVERQRIMRQARTSGFLTVDLQPLFLQEFATTGHTVDIPDDGHWNARGHEIVSQQIMKLLDIPRGLTKYSSPPVHDQSVPRP